MQINGGIGTWCDPQSCQTEKKTMNMAEWCNGSTPQLQRRRCLVRFRLQSNRFPTVLEHVLGVKYIKRVLGNSASKASNDNAKKRTPKKSQLRGRITTVPTHRRPTLICFFRLPRLFSKKMSGGLMGYRRFGRTLCQKKIMITPCIVLVLLFQCF